MSRSNPEIIIQNPCTRWFEWNGEKGIFQFYDKELKAKVDVPLPLTFLVLDQLYTITGWDDDSGSNIMANEVRDVVRNPFVVKSFKGGPIATGFYKDIKDRVNAKGGNYTVNIYVAFRNESKAVVIGSIKLSRASVSPWFEFIKQNPNAVNSGAISVAGFTTGKKGKVTYLMPTFSVSKAKIDEKIEQSALELDVVLQEYLAKYTSKPTAEAASESPFKDDVAQEDIPGPSASKSRSAQAAVDFNAFEAEDGFSPNPALEDPF